MYREQGEVIEWGRGGWGGQGRQLRGRRTKEQNKADGKKRGDQGRGAKRQVGVDWRQTVCECVCVWERPTDGETERETHTKPERDQLNCDIKYAHWAVELRVIFCPGTQNRMTSPICHSKFQLANLQSSEKNRLTRYQTERTPWSQHSTKICWWNKTTQCNITASKKVKFIRTYTSVQWTKNK